MGDENAEIILIPCISPGNFSPRGSEGQSLNQLSGKCGSVNPFPAGFPEVCLLPVGKRITVCVCLPKQIFPVVTGQQFMGPAAEPGKLCCTRLHGTLCHVDLLVP